MSLFHLVTPAVRLHYLDHMFLFFITNIASFFPQKTSKSLQLRDKTVDNSNVDRKRIPAGP